VDPLTQKHVAKAIDRALRRNGLQCDSPIRNELESYSEIGGGYQPEIQVRDESNTLVSLDRRIEQLRANPKFSQFFPGRPGQVSRHDHAKLRENFDAIARGTIAVK
jgi:hypothetical protein